MDGRLELSRAQSSHGEARPLSRARSLVRPSPGRRPPAVVLHSIVVDDTEERERRARAEERRATWAGAVVHSRAPKPALLEGMTPAERIAHLWQLSERAWRLAGREVRLVARAEWPGELFSLERVRGSGRASS